MAAQHYTQELERENQRLRMLLAGPPIGAAPAAPDTAPRPTPAGQPVPARLARTLATVEERADLVDALAREGRTTAAVDAALTATRETSAALGAVLDDAEFREQLMGTMRRGAAQPTPPVQNWTVHTGAVQHGVDFREAEIALLGLAGLHRALAEKHVDAAMAAHADLDGDGPGADAQQIIARLRAVEAAVRDVEAVVPFAMRSEPERARWRKLLTFGLGGTLIVGANAGATVVLGPIGVAVSGAIGSAALGAALAPLVT